MTCDWIGYLLGPAFVIFGIGSLLQVRFRR